MGKLYMDFSTKVHSFFQYLMSVKLQGQPKYSQTVKQLLYNNMPLFDYSSRDKKWHVEYNVKTLEKQLVSLLQSLSQSQTLASTPPAVLLGENTPLVVLTEGCPNKM